MDSFLNGSNGSHVEKSEITESGFKNPGSINECVCLTGNHFFSQEFRTTKFHMCA